MPDLSTEIRIFLSSTFIDLKDIRQEASHRLSQVLGARLIVMESFGSDDAPPVVSSVRRVRECDVFVGIYARRYGTVDPGTGKSITELELDEAESGLSAGNIIGILLYQLDDSAPWPKDVSETNGAAIEKLKRLKEHGRLHTVTTFEDPKELPFLVLRDTLSKIRSRLSTAPPKQRRIELPGERILRQPIGMEYFTSADRKHFYGRSEKVEELLGRLDSDAITLLLGNSGSGKTSLIHAGLLPRAIDKGWLPVYTRPLGFPRTDVARLFSQSVFEGPSL